MRESRPTPCGGVLFLTFLVEWQTHPSDHLCMVVDVELTSPVVKKKVAKKKEAKKEASSPHARKEGKKETKKDSAKKEGKKEGGKKDRKPPPKPPRKAPVTEGWVPPAPRGSPLTAKR